MKSVAQQQAELGRMVNAVSYERSDEKDNISGRTVCRVNKMTATKIGMFGQRTKFTKKACKEEKEASLAKTCGSAFVNPGETPNDEIAKKVESALSECPIDSNPAGGLKTGTYINVLSDSFQKGPSLEQQEKEEPGEAPDNADPQPERVGTKLEIILE